MPAATLTDALRDAITLADAVDYIPGRPHVATLHRWASRRGVRGGIRLETYLVGGIRMTTPAAIERFLRRLNGDAPLVDQIDAEDVARRGREADQALAAMGY